MMKKQPTIIAFDADDTLWHNEPYFDEAQERFCELFQDFASKQEILGLILNHQVKNLPLYGFGKKFNRNLKSRNLFIRSLLLTIHLGPTNGTLLTNIFKKRDRNER